MDSYNGLTRARHGHDDFLLNCLPHFNQLRCAGLGVGFELSPFRPMVGVIVVIHVAQHQAVLSTMHDHSHIPADSDGPEIRISGSIQLVEPQPRLGRIYLKVESRGLHSLLLVTGQLGEAVSKCVGDAEVHSGLIFHGSR